MFATAVLSVAFAGEGSTASPASLQTQVTSPPPATRPATKTATTRPRPLSGRIAEVDQVHKTIKVGKTVVQITSETRIYKDGKPALLADAKVGDEVGISYIPTEDGRNVARSVRIGPKPPPDRAGSERTR
ncbi:MAG: DUF5666 domain-containing protein [Verrucomicrobiota bacterium]|nr:DUF5666 domain-containing protein [Verrucomicrobiota bacterium]